MHIPVHFFNDNLMIFNGRPSFGYIILDNGHETSLDYSMELMAP